MKIFITSYLSMNNNFDHLVRGKCWLRFQKVHVLILVILLYVRVIQFLLPKREKYSPNKPNELFSKTSYENTFDFFDRHYILQYIFARRIFQSLHHAFHDHITSPNNYMHIQVHWYRGKSEMRRILWGARWGATKLWIMTRLDEASFARRIIFAPYLENHLVGR